MGLFSFAKDVGEKLFGKKDAPEAAPANVPQEPSAQEIANLLLKRVQDLGLNIEGLKVSYNGDTDKVTIEGTADTQGDRERAILAVGNVQYVSSVEDNITVAADEPESKMYEVQSGDTLSGIAQKVYGNGDYMKIFEANKPMLSDPNKIYPGQVLRIPA